MAHGDRTKRQRAEKERRLKGVARTGKCAFCHRKNVSSTQACPESSGTHLILEG
jgi:transcription elongation factor Elf1